MANNKLNFQANCQTTAMGIMPHADIDRALDLSLSLDIPYWPQLPNISYYEDMYAQLSEHFPGVSIDAKSEKVNFSYDRFEEELEDYSTRMADPETYRLSERYSAVYHRFLAKRLDKYSAIRGQVTGPVSFGFRVVDEGSKPIIYREDTRELLFDFVRNKVNTQYQELVKKNANAFVWFDEPGLGWVFSGLSGYNDVQARQDYHGFLSGIEGPKALHLCANVNLPYLLSLGIDLLSFDAYQIEIMPKGYTEAVANYLKSGGMIAWGIVPTDSEGIAKETPDTLMKLLLDYWTIIASNTNISIEEIAEKSLLAPARCCLKNTGNSGLGDSDNQRTNKGDIGKTVEENLVEKAFHYLKTISHSVRDMFKL